MEDWNAKQDHIIYSQDRYKRRIAKQYIFQACTVGEAATKFQYTSL